MSLFKRFSISALILLTAQCLALAQEKKGAAIFCATATQRKEGADCRAAGKRQPAVA